MQVFERLGLSLYDFMRKNSYKPFHLGTVRDFGVQLLRAVAYLHDLQLIHTDLKPENILLESSEYDKQTPPPGSRCGPTRGGLRGEGSEEGAVMRVLAPGGAPEASQVWLGRGRGGAYRGLCAFALIWRQHSGQHCGRFDL